MSNETEKVFQKLVEIISNCWELKIFLNQGGT